MLSRLTRLERAQKRLIVMAVDVALVPVALVLSLAVQFNTLDPALMLALWPLALPLMAFAVAGSTALGISKIQLKAYEFRGVGQTAIFAAALGLAAALIVAFQGTGLPLGVPLIFTLLFFLFSAASRFVMLRLLLALYAAERPRRRVLIYGAGTTGIQLASAFKADAAVRPMAFVDDSPALQGLNVAGLPVLSPAKIADIVRRRRIDRVLLAMPSLSAPKRSQIARRLERMGLEVQALPSFAQLIGEEALVEKLAPVSPSGLLGRAHLDEHIKGGCEPYAARSVLVSGAGGTIGSELCRQVLACKPARLVLYELSEFALYTVDMELRTLAEATGTEIVPVLGSVTDAQQVRRTLAENAVEVVLHAAAYKHVPLVEANPAAGLANNVLGTAALAHAARDAGVARFILVSSDKAVRPTSVMGASKRLSEMIVQDLASRSGGLEGGTIFAMVRFGNVLGSSGSVIPLFQNQIARGGPVTVTHSDVTRYFMTVQEAAQLVLRAGSFATGGDVFVLDMGKPVSIRALARQVIEAQGYTVRDADTPEGDIEIAVTGLRPGEKLHEELIIGAGAVTTPHEKIFCVRETCLSEIEVAAALRALRSAVSSGEPNAVRDVIVRWVEGYTLPIAKTS